MKNEMIKFVSENFEVIKAQFLKDEMDILEEMFEDEINNKEEFDHLSEFLIKQMNVLTAEELIDVINERSIGVDLDSDEVSELFDMIKAIKEAAN
jgi:retron-type reverse transcriptase